MIRLIFKILLLTILVVGVLSGCRDKADIRQSSWGDTVDEVKTSEKESYNNTDFEDLSFVFGANEDGGTQNIRLQFSDIEFTNIDDGNTCITYDFLSSKFIPTWKGEADAAINVLSQQETTLETPILLSTSLSVDVKINPLDSHNKRREEYRTKLLETLEERHGESEKINETYRWETDRTIIIYVPKLLSIDYLAKYDAVKDRVEEIMSNNSTEK